MSLTVTPSSQVKTEYTEFLNSAKKAVARLVSKHYTWSAFKSEEDKKAARAVIKDYAFAHVKDEKVCFDLSDIG
jgi:uncharacterized protein YktB (UPF0637 family)